MATIVMPPVPALGLPEGTKEAGQRVDIKPDQLTLLIETKGYRLAWTRAAKCPCAPVTTKTEQPDPNCTLCKGQGWLYFGDVDPTDWDKVGDVDEVQKAIIDDSGAMVILGIITNVRKQHDPVNKITRWVSGETQVTVRADNALGYYDRLVSLDTEIVFAEVLVADGTAVLPTRYPVTGINLIRSTTATYSIAGDLTVEAGVITWRVSSIPVSGTRIAVHYLCHPAWLVMGYPHAFRMSPVKFKSANTSTPAGDPVGLPIQANIQYDFLPEPS